MPRVFRTLACFDLLVESVLEDVATEAEGGAALTGGLTYAPVPPMDSELMKDTLRVLREP
jgi:hypothetical protein